MNNHLLEVVRYIINGLIATAVHFGVLTLNIEVFHFSSAGTANFIAAICGICVSFLGSRYFVFQQQTNTALIQQAVKFGSLYGCIALLHALVLIIWTDQFGFDYRIGFLLATIIQVLSSYLGNKFLVFK